MSAPPRSAAAGAPPPEGGTASRRGLALGAASQILGPLLSLLVLGFLIWTQNERFLSSGNLLNVLRQASFTAMLGIGMTFVILTGGVDLSVGSIVALSSVTGGLLMVEQGWGMWPAVGAMLAVGALCGLANGLIVTLGRIPPSSSPSARCRSSAGSPWS